MAGRPSQALRGGSGPALDSLAALRGPALAGPEEVLARAVEVLAGVAGCEAAILASAASGSWEIVARYPDGAGPAETALLSALTVVPLQRSEPSVVADQLTVIPLRPGVLALVVPAAIDPESALGQDLAVAAAGYELVLAYAERITEVEELVAELAALEAVAFDILSEREVDQVLLSIAHQTLALLDADMAGVLLRDGDRLVMRSCLGFRNARTAQLSMKAGEGVAGRVLATGEPCKVDSYLDSDAITHHFDPLAVAEDTQSALGAPLTAHGDVIGVLEVWRRRRSVFSDRHVRRIVALANLAAIAIDNARLYDRQQESLHRLAAAEASLSVQLSAMTQAHDLQRDLIGRVLDGEGLCGVVRAVADRTGGDVAAFSAGGEPLASSPGAGALDAMVATVRRIASAASTGGPVGDHPPVPLDGGQWLAVQEIRAGGDRLGWFCLVTAEPPGAALSLAVGEAALCCALSELEQRAAESALSEAREHVLWDLLEGAPDHRRAAVARAARLRLGLSGPRRVVHVVADDVDEVAGQEGWDARRLERVCRDFAAMVRRVVAEHGAGDLVAGRGDTVVAVVGGSGQAVRDVLAAVRAEAGRLVPGAVTCGVSGTRDDPSELHAAHAEAEVAVRAARRLAGDRVAVHDDLGIVRLLLASDPGADLAAFVDEVIGPLVEHDREHDGELVKTLRAWFEADCSQQEAARRLFVHHKTLRYRLDRIEALTSLDLHRHDDRVRADLALRILEVAQLPRLDG